MNERSEFLLSKSEDNTNKNKSSKNRTDNANEQEVVLEENYSDNFSIHRAVTVGEAVSVCPVEKEVLSGAGSYNQSEDGPHRESSTYGRTRSYIVHGLYNFFGGIDPRYAEMNGVTEADKNLLKNALSNLFTNPSSVRPVGSIGMRALIWITVDRESLENRNDFAVKDLIKAKIKDGVETPRSIDDYVIEVRQKAGIHYEIINFGSNVQMVEE